MKKFCPINALPNAIASTGSEIYLYPPLFQSMLIINTDNGSLQIIDSSVGIAGDAQAIIINNEYHIIGGFQNDKHVKWNSKILKFEILHDLKNHINWDNIGNHRLAMINDKILSFGGFSWKSFISLDEVYEFNITSSKWTATDIKLPRSIHCFGCVTVLNGQFVILFGGARGFDRCKDIWIYCVETKTFRRSNIQCPIQMTCNAFTIKDKLKDEMTVFGYIRREWRRSQIDDHLFPPKYLIKIMGRYYWNQEIHLFEYNKESVGGNHWKIDVLDIFS